jgi:hypothetical protein
MIPKIERERGEIVSDFPSSMDDCRITFKVLSNETVSLKAITAGEGYASDLYGLTSKNAGDLFLKFWKSKAANGNMVKISFEIRS